MSSIWLSEKETTFTDTFLRANVVAPLPSISSNLTKQRRETTTRGEEKGASWSKHRAKFDKQFCFQFYSHPCTGLSTNAARIRCHASSPQFHTRNAIFIPSPIPRRSPFSLPLHPRDFRWPRRQDFHVATIRQRSTDVSGVKVIRIPIDGIRERDNFGNVLRPRRHPHAILQWKMEERIISEIFRILEE